MRFRFFRARKKYVEFGERRFAVPPLSLTAALELFLLLSPYLPLIEEYLPQIQKILKDTSGERPRRLSSLLLLFRDEMKSSPGDITKAVGILAGVDPVWLAKNATGQELLAALPVLDEAHDMRRLWRLIRALGVQIRYES